ncbi:MAG: hypothetical protein ACLP29_00455 [Dissulfurispiraceae bacterium]
MDDINNLTSEVVKTVNETPKRIESSDHGTTTLTVSDKITALITQAKDLQKTIEDNQITLNKKMLCPVCQDGYLQESEKGKVFGFIPHKYFICRQCKAEFEKHFSKATLISAPVDPYNVFKTHKDKSLTLEEWKAIIQYRVQSENYDKEEKISAIKNQLSQYLVQQIQEKKFQFMPINLSCFILKKDEFPVFGTKAEVIEERKRKITQRTTTGGGRRNYAGFSFRVARGLYFHTGQSAPASQRQTSVQSSEFTELVEADDGDFLITNQRILFIGGKSRGLAIPIPKVAALHVDPEQNALMIVSEGKKPSILKLQTNFKATLSDIEVPISISLEHVVRCITGDEIERESNGSKENSS